MTRRRIRPTRRSRRRRLRGVLRAAVLLAALAAVTAGMIVLVRLMFFRGDAAEPPAEESAQTGREEGKRGFFSGFFNRNNGGSIFSGGEPEETLVPEPTPTPVPEFSPCPAAGTAPSDFGLETLVESKGVQMDCSQYSSGERIDFLEGDKYTGVEGVITFRGNNFRDSAAYGTVSVREKKFDTEPWSFAVGSMQKMYGSGSWTGCGWTGQPLLVRWPQSTKSIMNMYNWAKTKAGLVEAIYATMDGHIYFLDIETGRQTREPIDMGFPFKGAGALDPRGYPMMFLGSGDDSPAKGKDSSHAFIISLIDGSVMYEFGYQDPFRLRSLSYFDSSALVDAETDRLIYPGENGILYIIKLNTRYDEAAGSLSVAPEVVKWRYKGAQNGRTAKDGSAGWWLGMEDSAIIWRGHAIFTDNGGHMICLDLNTLETKWVQNVLDDTNCTGVLALEGADRHPYVYTSTSFHPNWRERDDQKAEIPIWKIDAVTGERVWTNTDYRCQTIARPNQVSGGVQGSLVSGKNGLSDLIFVPVAMTEGTKGKLVALSRQDGHTVWECDFVGYPWSSPVAVYDGAGNGYLIQCNKSGYIHLIDGRTGEILDEMSLGSNIEASPAVFDNTVVVGTRGGLIYGVTIK